MLSGALLLVTAGALAAPTAAHAEACTDGGPKAAKERARQDIAVVPGRSIGPIRIGMTRRAIARVAGRPIARPSRTSYRFRVDGLHVDVRFGRFHLARSLTAASNRLTIDDVPVATGPDPFAAAHPDWQRSDCGPNGDVEFYGPDATRRTSVYFHQAPRLTGVAITHTGMRR